MIWLSDEVMEVSSVVLSAERLVRSYFEAVYGSGNIKELKTRSGELAGLSINEELSIIGKEKRFNNAWKAIFNGVDTDVESVTIVNDVSIPKWYDIKDPQSITEQSELPIFSTDHNVDDVDTRSAGRNKKNIKIFQINDHTIEGKVEVSLWRYLEMRAKTELNPNFAGDYHLLLYILKHIYIETFGNTPYCLKLLKAWMLRFGMRADGTFFNPVRTSGGEIVAWSTDSHFLKRISVVINSMVMAIFQEDFISVYPKYIDVLNEVVKLVLPDPVGGVRKMKKLHSAVALSFCTFSPNSSKSKMIMKDVGNFRGLSDPLSHRHVIYPDFQPSKEYLRTKATYTKPKVCIKCDDIPMRDYMTKRNAKTLIESQAEARKIGLNATAEMMQLVMVDTYNEIAAVALSAYNMLMSISGFTETNKTVDILNTYNEAKEFTQAEDIDTKGEKKQLKEEFKRCLEQTYKNMTQLCMDENRFMDPVMFKSGLLSMVTGSSAGVGTYSMTIENEEIREITLKFTDKRFVALIEGQTIYDYSSKDLSQTFEAWNASFKRIYDVNYSGFGMNSKPFLDPMRFSNAPGPLVQMTVGVRSVPGGRAIRAIYVKPLKEYVLERLLYPYVDAFKDGLRSDYVMDKYPNNNDFGNINAKMRLDNTEDFLSPLIMCSTMRDYSLYWIDYSQFDMTETYDGFRKYKYSGVRKALSEVPLASVHSKPYCTIDGRPAYIHECLNFSEKVGRNSTYYLRDGFGLKEINVNFLTSGSLETFDDNTTNNGVATSLLERAMTAIASVQRLEFVTIAGDDNAGAFDISGMSEVEYGEAERLVRDFPKKLGFRINELKSGVGQRGFEMAKIASVGGFVVRLGNTQLLESEKVSNAGTLVEQLRGLTNKFQLFMNRYPCSFFTVSKLQAAILCGLYKLDVTGKTGIGIARNRKWYLPPLGVQYINPDKTGGLGATVTGNSTSEQILLYYSDELTKEYFAVCNAIAGLIAYKKLERVSDAITEAVLLKAGVDTSIGSKNTNGSNGFKRSTTNVKTVLNPQGLLVDNPFGSVTNMIKLNEAQVMASRRADDLLRRGGIELPNHITYFNMPHSLLRDSVKSAVTNQVKSVLDHKTIVSDVVNLKINAEEQLRDFMRRYPLAGHYDLIFMDELKRQYVTNRYPCVMNRINDMYNTFGVRFDRLSPTSTSVMRPYFAVLQSARRHGTFNPSITEESLRDIISGALNRTKAHLDPITTISNIIIALFGNLPELLNLVNDIVRDSWGFPSAAIGFSMTGSNMVYVDASQTAIDKVVSVRGVIQHLRLVQSLFFYIAFAAATLTGVPRKVDVYAINENDMAVTANLMVAQAITASNTRKLFEPSFTSGL